MKDISTSGVSTLAFCMTQVISSWHLTSQRSFRCRRIRTRERHVGGIQLSVETKPFMIFPNETTTICLI